MHDLGARSGARQGGDAEGLGERGGRAVLRLLCCCGCGCVWWWLGLGLVGWVWWLLGLGLCVLRTLWWGWGAWWFGRGCAGG